MALFRLPKNIYFIVWLKRKGNESIEDKHVKSGDKTPHKETLDFIVTY